MTSQDKGKAQSTSGHSDSVKQDASESIPDNSSFSFLRTSSPAVSDKESASQKQGSSDVQNEQPLPPIQKAKKKKKRQAPIVGYGRSQMGEDMTDSASVVSHQQSKKEDTKEASSGLRGNEGSPQTGSRQPEDDQPSEEPPAAGVLAGLNIRQKPASDTKNNATKEATGESTEQGSSGVLSGLNIRQLQKEISTVERISQEVDKNVESDRTAVQEDNNVEAEETAVEEDQEHDDASEDNDDDNSGTEKRDNPDEPASADADNRSNSPLSALRNEQRKEIQSLDSSVQEVEKVLSEVPKKLQSSASSFSQQWQEIQEDIRELGDTRKQTEERVADLQKEVARTQKDIDQAVASEEFENAEALNQTLESLKYELEDALKQQDHQTHRLVELEDERASLLLNTSSTLEQLTSEISGGKSVAKRTMEEMKRTLEEHKQSVEEKVRHERQQLKFKKATAERELNHIQEERSTVENTISEEGGALEADRDHMEKQLKSISDEITELEKKLSQKRQQYEKTKSKYESLDKRLQVIREGYRKQLETLKYREQESENERQQYEEHFRQLDKQEKELREYVDKEESELESLKLRSKELKFDGRCSKAILRAVNETIAQRKQFIGQIKSDVKQLKECFSQLSNINSSVQSIQGELHLKEVEYANEQRNGEQIDEKVNKLSEDKRQAVEQRRFKEASRLKAEIESFQQRKDEQSEKMKRLASKIDELNQEYDSKNSELSSAREQVKAMESKLQEAHKNLATKALATMTSFRTHLEDVNRDESQGEKERKYGFVDALRKLVDAQIKGLKEEARSLGATDEMLAAEPSVANAIAISSEDSDESDSMEQSSPHDEYSDLEGLQELPKEELQQRLKDMEDKIEECVSAENYEEADNLEKERQKLEHAVKSKESVAQEDQSDRALAPQDFEPSSNDQVEQKNAFSSISTEEINSRIAELQQSIDQAAEKEDYDEADLLEKERTELEQELELRKTQRTESSANDNDDVSNGWSDEQGEGSETSGNGRQAADNEEFMDDNIENDHHGYDSNGEREKAGIDSGHEDTKNTAEEHQAGSTPESAEDQSPPDEGDNANNGDETAEGEATEVERRNDSLQDEEGVQTGAIDGEKTEDQSVPDEGDNANNGDEAAAGVATEVERSKSPLRDEEGVQAGAIEGDKTEQYSPEEAENHDSEREDAEDHHSPGETVGQHPSDDDDEERNVSDNENAECNNEMEQEIGDEHDTNDGIND